MGNWLTNWDDARKKPVRSLTALVLFVSVFAALGDYYLANTRSVPSAVGIGGICAVVIARLGKQRLWPNRSDRTDRHEG